MPLQGSLAGIGVNAFLFGTDIDFNFTPQAASTATVMFGTDSADGTVMGSIAVATPEPATIALLGAGLAGLLGFRPKVSPNRMAVVTADTGNKDAADSGRQRPSI